MSRNALRAHLASGTPAVGGWCTTASPLNAEILAAAGFAYVGVDCQHGLIGHEAMVAMLTAIGHTGATPLVRVPPGSGQDIARALDAGAEVIVVPMVESRADAEAAVAASRYPPAGHRSFGPVRATLFLNDGAAPHQVDDEVLCLVMIETAAGVAAVDEICATPGVDGLYIGPVDLALSLGPPPGAAPTDDVVAAIATTQAAARRHGVLCGIHAEDGEVARRRLEQGFDIVSISSDARLFRLAAIEQLRLATGAGRAPAKS